MTSTLPPTIGNHLISFPQFILESKLSFVVSFFWKKKYWFWSSRLVSSRHRQGWRKQLLLTRGHRFCPEFSWLSQPTILWQFSLSRLSWLNGTKTLTYSYVCFLSYATVCTYSFSGVKRVDRSTGPIYFVSVVFTPHSPSIIGSVWLLPAISLLLTNTVSPVRASLSLWLERFRGIRGLLVC